MAGFFSKLKDKLTPDYYDEEKTDKDGYVEVDEAQSQTESSGVTVRTFSLDDFEAVKPILEAMRLGETVCLVNIKPLKEKDIIELKRAINKLKKTCTAIEGDIAGFDDDWIVIVPQSVSIYKTGPSASSEDMADNN